MNNQTFANQLAKLTVPELKELLLLRVVRSLIQQKQQEEDEKPFARNPEFAARLSAGVTPCCGTPYNPVFGERTCATCGLVWFTRNLNSLLIVLGEKFPAQCTRTQPFPPLPKPTAMPASSRPKQEPVRCACCHLPVAEWVDDGTLLIEARHHGERHQTLVRIAQSPINKG